jgi:K+-sensing histidine kinase KdpD
MGAFLPEVARARSRRSAVAAARIRLLFRWSAVRGYLAGAAIVLLCTLLALAGAPVEIAAFMMAFPLAVLMITARFGIGPAMFTSVVGVFMFDYVFVPPAFAFSVPNLKDGLTLAIMVAVAVVASVLAERLRRQAQHARRQAEIERLRNALLSALSHDLRTPLNALVGASQALFEERLDAAERREFSRMVAVEATRLNRLVGNLLELTRLESGQVNVELAPQAIDEVIGSALCRLEHRLQDRPLRTDVPEEVPLVAFDPVLMEQVFINLLENVILHTPNASPVEISVRGDGNRILIEVADRGPGVPVGDEERVFEKLYRADRAGDGGVGLGLTICRAIMTAHDGRIWLENRGGGGAVVRLTLPVRSAADARPLPSSPFAVSISAP